jgi:hypothetical protein
MFAVIGSIVGVPGLALIVVGVRRRAPPPDKSQGGGFAVLERPRPTSLPRVRDEAATVLDAMG